MGSQSVLNWRAPESSTYWRMRASLAAADLSAITCLGHCTSMIESRPPDTLSRSSFESWTVRSWISLLSLVMSLILFVWGWDHSRAKVKYGRKHAHGKGRPGNLPQDPAHFRPPQR
jgi:hypothetical protein